MEMQQGNGATLESALAIVRAAGFKVTKPKAQKAMARPALNCLGLPISPLYDPAYKMKYKAPQRAAYGNSSAATKCAASMYRAAMQLKHADNAALLAEVLGRNGVR